MGNPPSATSTTIPRQRRRSLLVAWLYFLAVVREFRWTLFALVAVSFLGGILYVITPQPELAGHRPSFSVSLYGAWMAMLAQPIYSPSDKWYLLLLCAVYPVFGILLIGEGVVRFAMLMISRKRGEKEWMRVMASTYRNHVILCGIGHLGARVLQELVGANVPVVVLEKDQHSGMLPVARELGVPVLVRNMKEDQALIDAGIAHARAIIIATNDDMANLEVALDARRLNPKIRVIMRLFDQHIASKISDALSIDVAFSSSALAAPIVAAMCLEAHLLSSCVIAGVPHVTSEITVSHGSPLADRRLDHLEAAHAMRVLARTPHQGATQSPPSPGDKVAGGDTLIVHAPTAQLAALAAAARGENS